MSTDARKLIEALGAIALKGRENRFELALKPLALTSVFSKTLEVTAQLELLSSQAFCFHAPEAMKALGPLWIEGLDHKSQIISAIQDAIHRLERRLRTRIQNFEQWGLKNVHLHEPEAWVMGTYEFSDASLVYRLDGDLEVTLAWVNEQEVDATAYAFSLVPGQERRIIEQTAKAHYQQYFDKEPPAIVPVLPAFGPGSSPVYARVAQIEELVAHLQAQIKKAEAELVSLKAMFAYVPVPDPSTTDRRTSSGIPRAAKEKTEAGDSLGSLAHLIAPMSDDVADIDKASDLGMPEDFEGAPATVAMDLVPAVPATDMEASGHEHDFESIKDTVAMDLVPEAENPLLANMTHGEAIAPMSKAKTEEDPVLSKAALNEDSQDDVGEQLEALLAESSEPEMGIFGKSFTGEHVFESENRLHQIPSTPFVQSDEKASIAETENADFEKETDAALMVAQASAFEKVPGTANYELGQSDIVDDAQEAQFVSEPPPWSIESEADQAIVPLEAAPSIALIINNPKALKKLNENLGQHIDGLLPAVDCEAIESHLASGHIRWLIFVRPAKDIVDAIESVKTKYPEIQVIVVSNDVQTFGPIGAIQHLLPLVNQVSQVAKGILEIID